MNLNYHTYKEIRQQPEVWKKTYGIILERKDEIKAFTDKYLALGYEVVLAGAGTSAYIGDALEHSLFRTRFKNAKAISTTDLITSPEHFFDSDSKVLMVSFARSGNSPESVGAIRATEKTAGKVAHIYITCNKDGELAKTQGPNILSVLLPPETNDLSLAMTSSYSSMFLACALIANIDKIEEQRNMVDTLSDCVAASMEKNEDAIREIASRNFQRAIFLGSGPLKGVAEESRLKLQELTDGRVMCAYDSFLGFRHGPKAVVNSESLLVYLLSPLERVRRYELDLIRQVKANNDLKGTIAICRRKEDMGDVRVDLCIETGLPDGPGEVFPGCYGAIAYIFVAQLLGMFKSIDLGLSPDSPSVSGNISRVVEGVILYI